jgi:hypothetical protein
MGEEGSRKDIWVARAKAWGTVIAAVGGLVTALSAFLKPRDDSATKAAYLELAKGQEGLSTDVQSLHTDVAALRGYIAAKEGSPPPAPQAIAEAPAPVDAGATAAKPATRSPHAPAAPPTRPKPTVVTLGEIDIAGHLGGGQGAVAYAPAPPAASIDFPPPTVHDVPTLVHPPTFDQVVKAAAK